MKMKFKKETKRTVVYETDDLMAPIESVYVAKTWLAANGGYVAGKGFAAEINLTAEVCKPETLAEIVTRGVK